MSRQRLTNFGRNLAIEPQALFTPASEDDVLAILREHRGQRIRAIGRLHSWSDTLLADDVLLDLRNLNSVKIERDEHGTRAVLGAGCQIKDVLCSLDRQGLTLPTVGLISEQTIAGATATGTHGSGRSSLSHYIESVRIACYDRDTCEPVIREVREAVELRAARCSLGCLGIVLSVEIRPRPQYRVEEWFRLHETLADVLAAEFEAPLQQFFLIPWQWKYMGQHRRETDLPRSRLATLYRWYWFATIDLGLHLCLLCLVRVLRSRRAIQTFFRKIIHRTVIRDWHVVDRSQDMLIMEHELFRHVEVELFVTQSQLPDAVTFVIEVIRYFDGDFAALSPVTRQHLENLGVVIPSLSHNDLYTHHYPICIRRVLPDDTLISMTGDCLEPCYALSFISYAHPTQRAALFQFARFLVDSMAALFDTRPHWGKICPLTSSQVERLYPHVQEFRDICRQFDHDGQFQNTWTERVVFPKTADRLT